MKPRQRQAAILEHLQSQGKCSVEELAQHFDTTGTTIRKDLVILELGVGFANPSVIRFPFEKTVAWSSTKMSPTRLSIIRRSLTPIKKR